MATALLAILGKGAALKAATGAAGSSILGGLGGKLGGVLGGKTGSLIGSAIGGAKQPDLPFGNLVKGGGDAPELSSPEDLLSLLGNQGGGEDTEEQEEKVGMLRPGFSRLDRGGL